MKNKVSSELTICCLCHYIMFILEIGVFSFKETFISRNKQFMYSMSQ